MVALSDDGAPPLRPEPGGPTWVHPAVHLAESQSEEIENVKAVQGLRSGGLQVDFLIFLIYWNWIWEEHESPRRRARAPVNLI